MTAPAIVQTRINKDGKEYDKVIQKAQGVLRIVEDTNTKKKEQNAIIADGVKKEEQATTAAQERAQTEQKVTETKKKGAKTDKPKTTSDGGTTPPPPSNVNKSTDGGNKPGGILGLLSDLAKEDTLSSIATLLSQGIKISSDNKEGTKGSKNKKDWYE